jgi:hypothetical protein
VPTRTFAIAFAIDLYGLDEVLRPPRCPPPQARETPQEPPAN